MGQTRSAGIYKISVGVRKNGHEAQAKKAADILEKYWTRGRQSHHPFDKPGLRQLGPEDELSIGSAMEK